VNRWLVAGLILLTGLALGLRAPRLALRPLHNDEAVNAMKFGQLWVNNSYRYDPNEFHGPALPYFTWPAAWLDGSPNFNQFTESTFRGVTVAFGAALVLLLLLVATELGRAETLWAAALTAISPAMVFYSRYYIHEMLLVFFTALSFFCAWRYLQSARLAWALASGLALGLMAATKETFLFALAAAAFSALATEVWGRWRDRDPPTWSPQWRRHHLVGAFCLAAGTALLFFSSFFHNASGPGDALRTYLPWLRRAGGATEHAHEWTFYFQRLLFFHSKGTPVWSEAFIVALAALGFFSALLGSVAAPAARSLRRLIAFYTLCLTLIYTVLAYKTPWCLLGFYHGMILLAGTGAAALGRACRSGWPRTLALAALAAGAGQLAWQACAENFASDKNGVPYCDSAKNPYVYSQTVPDALRLVHTVEAIAQVAPQRYDTIVEIMGAESYWPLPWYLRRFKHIGYFDRIPNQPLAPIMMVSTTLHAAFDDRPEKTHLMAGYFELRPGVFFELYVNLDLWRSYIKTLPPEDN
jgi:uncharacterized protein (TIGR03663 family)